MTWYVHTLSRVLKEAPSPWWPCECSPTWKIAAFSMPASLQIRCDYANLEEYVTVKTDSTLETHFSFAFAACLLRQSDSDDMTWLTFNTLWNLQAMDGFMHSNAVHPAFVWKWEITFNESLQVWSHSFPQLPANQHCSFLNNSDNSPSNATSFRFLELALFLLGILGVPKGVRKNICG